MADDNSTDFKLNLDSSEFIASAKEAQEAISSIGDVESLSALLPAIASIGLAFAPIIVSVLAVKEAFDATFDAENIRAVGAQFEILSKQAGSVSSTLIEGLKESSKGWIDETSLMQDANKALAGLQISGESLVGIMDMARKTAAIMGGSVEENFQAIARAVETGSTRQLRHLGIIIDQQKAYKDYAVSIGVTVDALSQAGKQQAIYDALMEQNAGKFAGINTNIKENANNWQIAKAAMKEFWESVTLGIDSVFGPMVTKFVSGMASIAQALKFAGIKAFGTEAQKAGQDAQWLGDHLKYVQEQIAKFKFDEKSVNPEVVANAKIQLAELNKELQMTEQQLNVMKSKSAGAEVYGPPSGAAASQALPDKVDKDKLLTQQAKFNADMGKLNQQKNQLDAQMTAQQVKDMTTVEEATKLYNKQLEDAEAEYNQKIAQIWAERAKIKAQAQKGEITGAQAVAQYKALNDQEVKLNQLKNKAIEKDDAALAQMQQQALDNYVKKSETAYDGVARAFQATAQKNKMAMSDMGKFGESAVAAFSSSAVSNIQAFGAGTKSATDAVEGMFASMAGQMASQYGEMMMLASIWPPNPVGFAAGVALIALGGMLSSIGGGSSSSSGSTASVGSPSSSPISVDNPTSNTPLTQSDQQAAPQKSVTLQVMGNVFDSSNTQRWLVDQIRAASDATDFTIQSVGGGF